MDVELWALPFSKDTLAVTGKPFLVRKNATGSDVSNASTLTYSQSGRRGQSRLVWVDRNGVEVSEIGKPQLAILNPRVLPGGDRIAVTSAEGDGQPILQPGTSRLLLRSEELLTSNSCGPRTETKSSSRGVSESKTWMSTI